MWVSGWQGIGSLMNRVGGDVWGEVELETVMRSR